VLPKPQDLGPERLAAQAIAAKLANRLPAVAPLQLLDLWAGARINAVQDRRSYGPPELIDRHQARPKRADSDGADSIALRDLAVELARDRADLAPPHAIGVHLGPSGPRHFDRVTSAGLCQDRAVRPAEDCLRGGAADVDAKEQVGHSQARAAQGEIAPDDVDAGGIDDAILARGIEWRPLPVRADLEATLIVGRHAPERLVVVDPGGQLI